MWAPIYKTGLSKYLASLDQFFSKLAYIAPNLFSIPFSFFGYAARNYSHEKVAKVISSFMGQADKKLVENEIISKSMALDIKESFRNGSKGPSQDTINLYRNWGFDLQHIQPEILIFHGTDDHFAPIEFVTCKHEQLKRSRYFEYPGEGHLYF